MGENTKIQWAHHTFNAWIGCEKISEACKFCYAEQYASRWEIAKWGKNGTRYRTATSNWNKLRRWNKQAEEAGERRRVFCFSLSDIGEIHEQIPQQWRDDFFALVRDCFWLDFLLLTKRPENYAQILPADWGDGYENVWLGCSVENQKRYDHSAVHMAAIPAKIKFFSMEPLLGYVRMNWMPNWIIIGGESGFKKDARRLDMHQVLSIMNQAEGKGVKIFFKQLGTQIASTFKMKQDPKGGDFSEYPEGIGWVKVRQVPETMLHFILRAQKENDHPKPDNTLTLDLDGPAN